MIVAPEVFAIPAKRVGYPAPCAWEFEPVWNDPHSPKPGGGLWTSRFTGRLTLSEWTTFATGINYGPWFRWWLVHPRRDARVYEINSYADLLDLINRYPVRSCLCPMCQLGFAEYHPDPRVRELLFPAPVDYVAMCADGWDGVHLTSVGQSATRLPLSMDRAHNLYGWDAESTIWLRWEAIVSVEYMGYWRESLGQQYARRMFAEHDLTPEDEDKIATLLGRG